MKSKNRYFLYLSLIFVGLFVFCCFSIIYSIVFLNATPAEKRAGNTLSLIALFVHLIIVSVGFYWSLKAYLYKSSIVAVIMVTDRGEKNPRSYRNTLIFSIIFGIFAIFFALNSFGALHLTSILTISLNLMLTNLGFTVSFVALYLFFYKPIPLEEFIEE